MSERATPLDLEAIEARCEKATPGPWHINGSNIRPDSKHADPYRDGSWPSLATAWDFFTIENVGRLKSGSYDANLAFIAHARADIPALVAEVRRLREVLRTIANQECGESSNVLEVRWARAALGEPR